MFAKSQTIQSLEHCLERVLKNKSLLKQGRLQSDKKMRLSWLSLILSLTQKNQASLILSSNRSHRVTWLWNFSRFFVLWYPKREHRSHIRYTNDQFNRLALAFRGIDFVLAVLIGCAELNLTSFTFGLALAISIIGAICAHVPVFSFNTQWTFFCTLRLSLSLSLSNSCGTFDMLLSYWKQIYTSNFTYSELSSLLDLTTSTGPLQLLITYFLTGYNI